MIEYENEENSIEESQIESMEDGRKEKTVEVEIEESQKINSGESHNENEIENVEIEESQGEGETETLENDESVMELEIEQGEGEEELEGENEIEEMDTPEEVPEQNGQRYEDEVEEEDQDKEGENNQNNEHQNGENPGEIEVIDVEKDNERIVRLPLSKIKKIMKTDDQVTLVNKDALIATTILAEHFISMVAQQSYKLAAASKKKTVTLNHVKSAIASSSMFDFLEGTLPILDS